jgi:hypothetical protein
MKLPFPSSTRRAPLILTALLATAPAVWADETFKASLSGDQEVPPVATDAAGRFKIQFHKAESAAELTLAVSDGQGITQAHLHCAPAGVNGPVVVFVAGFNAAGQDIDGKWISNATATGSSIVNIACGTSLAELAASMRAGMVYVNVHSVGFPGGVIRGQLELADED